MPSTTAPSKSVENGLEVAGDLHVAAGAVVPAGVACDGSATLDERARIEGDLVADGSVSLGAHARVDGVIRARDGILLHPTASTGGLRSEGPLRVGDATVAGAVEVRRGVELVTGVRP